MRFGLLAMVVATGCVFEERPDDGGQFGEEGAACVAVERTALALDEASALGFAPQSLLDAAAGEHSATLTWSDGGATPLAISVTPVAGGAIELVDYEFLDEDGEPSAMEMGCADLVEIEVDVTFATEDGAFAEAWSGRLTSPLADAADLWHDLDAVAGSFDPWDHAPAGNTYDEVRAWVSITFAAGDASGAVSGQGSGTEGDPSDPDSVAYAENLEIGRFGPAQ